MEALNPTIPSKPQFFSSLSIFSPKYSLRTWKKKNLYRFNIPNSKIPLYPPFSASKLRISAHFGRPTNRRNSLRKKLIEEQQQQVRHRSQNPVLDYDNSEIYYSNLGNDSVEKSKFSSNYGVSEGSVDSDSIEELKSKGLGESVLWNKLESWVDQYKNDSEFWGIGFNPIFTVFQDSGGNVERVVVNEDEILRRSGIEMEMYKKSEIEDLTEVNSKISHAKFLAREMENGNCVFSKSSSVAKFIVSGKHRGFDNAIWGLALRPGLSLKLPRIGIMVLCGLFVFWAMKAIFSGGKEKVEYTRLEKEIMRRKMKARKEKEKLVTGSVEVIQDPMEPQIERPRLNEQDLMNSITKVKASSNNTLALHESSSDRAVSKDLDSKIQEIRAMARQAREIERRDPSPSDTDGGDDLTVNELTDEKEVVKQHGVVVILPNDLSIEYSGQMRGVNGTSTPMSINDVENNDTEFSEEVLVENIDTQTSSTSSMKVSNDGESTTREGVVSLPNGLSNEDSDQVEGDDGTLTPKFNDLKNNDARFGEEVLLENSGTQTASTSIMKVSNDGESTIQDVINRESAVNISDTTNVSQSSNTFESHSRKLKRSFGTKPRVIRSVKEAREFLSQKRNKQEPNQEYQEKTVPEGAAILSIEREKDTNSNARKGIDKDNEVSGTTILDGTSDFAPAINAGKDSALKRKESVPAEKSGPQAADEGCKEIGPSVLALSREREMDSNTSLGLDKDNKIFQSTILRGPSNSASAASAFGDSTRKIMDGDPEDVEGGYQVDDLQKPPTSSVNESNSRSSEKISSVNKESWMEKIFHQLEPVVKKIEGGFRDNYMVAREKVKQELDTNFEMIQSKFDEDDAELDWMKDDRLREIVFQVRENELAGRDPFYLMDDEDKLGFFKGLERKVEKENEKLSSLHEYLHSNIENLDYGADGISMYDPPEKIIPRWKGPPLDRKPEFPNNFAEQRATLSARNFSNSDIERKDGQNFPQKSKEPPANENVQLTSAVNNQNTKILEGNSRSPKTVIEGSDGSVRAGKKSGKEYWQHTKKWSRGFLESYNAEADPETKAIMKDIGKDLDRWITEKEIEEAADLMDKISERGRKFIDKKLNKVKREMELFGPQAVMSKYREYAEEKEEDYLWWLDLPFVLCIELYTHENGEQKVGFYSLEMAEDLELDPKQYHVIAFEDPGDCKNLCYIMQAHMEMIGNGNAFVVARPPKDAFREAKANGLSVTVIRKGVLQLNVDQTLEEVEEQITEIGTKIYHDKIMREQSVDISALTKGVFGAMKPSKRRRSRRKLKKHTK
ncbi:unnamed protein product [Camellia sinensis]